MLIGMSTTRKTRNDHISIKFCIKFPEIYLGISAIALTNGNMPATIAITNKPLTTMFASSFVLSALHATNGTLLHTFFVGNETQSSHVSIKFCKSLLVASTSCPATVLHVSDGTTLWSLHFLKSREFFDQITMWGSCQKHHGVALEDLGQKYDKVAMWEFCQTRE